MNSKQKEITFEESILMALIMVLATKIYTVIIN
jgi:hypothetical protein